MKKSLLIWIFISITLSVFSQSPQKMTYQAVIRNSNNQLLQNQQVGVKISILQGSVNGIEVFAETHTLTTNTNGLLSLIIGNGNAVSGAIQTIDWGADTYFIKTETDPNGGTNYSIEGVSQLLTVPYAFYADSAGNNFSGDYLDLANTPTNLSDFNNDQGFITSELDDDPTNELQILSISNDTLFLSNGGFAVIPASFDGQYSSLIGAPTNVSSFINDVGYITNELDGDSTNELQTLNIANDSISISNGNTIPLPTDKWFANGNNIYYNQGNVGIGTTTPCSSCKLEVHGNLHLKGAGDFVAWSPDETSTKAVMFADNGSVRMGAQGGDLRLLSNSALSNTERMRITTTGRVGIGTTTPSANLHVSFSGAGHGVIVDQNSTTNGNVIHANALGTGGSTSSAAALVRVTSASNFRPLMYLESNLGASVYVSRYGDIGIGNTSPDEKLHISESGTNSAAIKIEQSGTGGREWSLVSTGSANSAGSGNFLITDETAVQTRIAIDNNGNVGIGLTDPCSTCKLEVNGNINTRDGGDFTAWSPDGTSSQTFLLAANGSGRIGNKGGPLVFTTNTSVSSSSSSSERARITTSGQLGIGTGSNVTSDNNVLLHLKNPSSANTGILIESGNGDKWQMYAHTNDHWGIYEEDASASRLIVNAGGNVGIGTLAPTSLLSVNGTASKPGGGSWAVFSDRRLKKNIQPYQEGLSNILQIRPVTFQYNGTGGIADTETQHVGVIAQEIQEIAPSTVQTVETNTGEYLEFDPSSLDFMMINAIQELNEKLEQMQEKIELLEKENAELQAK